MASLEDIFPFLIEEYSQKDSFVDESEYQIIEKIEEIGDNPFRMYNINFKYKIIQQIGQGSYGSVYIVEKGEREKDYKKLFAMKVIDVVKLAEARAEDKDRFIKRFNEKILKEFNLRYVLQEKCKNNLVCYYEIFKTNDEKIFLIMTLVEGKQLGFINSKSMPEFTIKDLTYDRKFKITKDVINAVNVLHKHNIVHRDIKLDNIIYDENNGNTTLIDYGFSFQIPKIPLSQDCEGIAGTEFYMHPDLIKLLSSDDPNLCDLDWKNYDIFSLAYCLYLLWTYVPNKNYYSNTQLYDTFYETSNKPNDGNINFKIIYFDLEGDEYKEDHCRKASEIINKLLRITK